MEPEPQRGPLYVARVPMIAAASAFATGILAARYIFHPVYIWLAAALLLSAAAFYLRVRIAYVAYATALAAMLCVGGFVSEARESVSKPPNVLAQFADRTPVIVTGTVMRDGVLRAGPFGSPDESVDVAVESVETAEGVVAVHGGARLSIYAPQKRESDENLEEDSNDATPLRIYKYGEQLRLTAKLHPPLNYRNPGSFDYIGYLDGIGVQVLGSAKADSVTLLDTAGGAAWQRWRWAVRRRVLAQIHAIWPKDEAALFDAMLLGERAFLSQQTQTEFQRTGTFHILVVSGMNVGIFAVALYWLLRRVRAGVELATVLTILMATSYALLTDLGAPILRSLLMLAVYQTARVFYRERAALNAVGVAALGLLLWEPRQLFEASFQLTFLSVAAISGICVPLFERTTEPRRRALRRLHIVGYDQSLAPKLAQWRIDLRMFDERLQRILGTGRIGKFVSRKLVVGIPSAALALAELIVVSATMQVVLALPMVWYFHRLPFRGLLANVAVVPLTGVLMPACVVAVSVSFASLWIAKAPALIASYALAGITGTVHTLGTSSPYDHRIAQPSLAICVACGLAIVLMMWAARRHRALALAGVATLLATTVWIALPRAAEAHASVMEVTAIDVGQGESLLIVAPDGKRLLLDSGGQLGFSRSEFDIGEQVTSSYLWNRGIDRLDAVAISHPHSDHMQGMAAIIANFRPKELWISEGADTPSTRALLETCARFGVRVTRRSTGNTWDFGGTRFEVLEAETRDEVNPRVLDDSSIVLRASFGKTSILLPGDAHKKIESQISGREIRADVLKVGHHGSATSTSAAFLDAVHPRFALISVGRGNSFGHPRADVLARLAEHHVQTFRTDLFGPVTLFLDGEKVTWSVPR